MASTRLLRAFLSLAFLLAAADAAAQMYRWTDAQGRTHYTDTPPPKEAITAEEKRLKSNVSTGGDTSYAYQDALKRNPVKLYTTGKCEPCNEARAFLTKRGVPYSETLLGDNDKAREQLRKLGAANDGLPVLTVGERVHKGFYPDSWESSLSSAGYSRYGPKAAPAKPDTKTADPKAPAAKAPAAKPRSDEPADTASEETSTEN